VKLLEALAPGHDPEVVLEALARAAKRRRIAIVGHEPGLGELAAALLGARRPMPFRKGGVCRIDVQGLSRERAGVLQWFVPPKVLRALE
jgi:phosphohistidine phosphatase SixA